MDLDQIKSDIKKWEQNFLNTFSRLPKGKDIYEAPDDIRRKYKIYKEEKNKKILKEKDVNDLWNIRINHNHNGKIENVENVSADAQRRERIKAMSKEPIEIPIKIAEIQTKEIEEIIEYKVVATAVNLKRKLPEVKAQSFMKRAPDVNIDRYLKPEPEKIVPQKSAWERSGVVEPLPAVIPNDNFSAPAPKRIKTGNEQSGNFVKLNKKFKSICTKATKKQQSARNAIKRSKWSTAMSSTRKCYNCQQMGHYSNQCTTRKKYGPYDERSDVKALGFNEAVGTVSLTDFRLMNLDSVESIFCCRSLSTSENCSALQRDFNNKIDEIITGEGEFNADVITVDGSKDFLPTNDDNGVPQTQNKLSDINGEPHSNNLANFTRPSLFDTHKVIQNQLTNFTICEDELQEFLQKSLSVFGFASFRGPQESIIRRICVGQSTLAVMPTGSGKSLCYQIPAFIHHQTRGAVALVISPLISLMQDQLARLPAGIRGVALNSTLKLDARKKLLAEIRDSQYAFVLLSPEALVESNWLTPDILPPISFVCIDEVHCLSDWSHHFRPSYLRVCKLLRDRYSVSCFLGLSATCTSSTIRNIAKYLSLDLAGEPLCCIRGTPFPDNITISVTETKDKEETLITLLQRAPIATSSSILIYCSTREETNEIATLINVKLQKLEISVGKKKLTFNAEAYHAGLTLPARSRLQRRFMSGRLRILVGTVAFGMGLDKSDLRTVIHFSRPQSFENYVQEIGRVGRDGVASYAHTLMVATAGGAANVDAELNDLHRHTFANHVEPVVLTQFMRSVFTVAKSCVAGGRCRGHVHAIRPSEMAVELNVREETLMTLLCYLDLYEDSAPCLRILPANYRYLKLNCYRGVKQMAELSHKSLAVSTMLTAKHVSNAENITGLQKLSQDMIEFWDKYGLDVASLRKELYPLKWSSDQDREGTTRYFPSGVSLEFSDWHWIVAVRCDVDEDSMARIYDHLLGRLNQLETSTIGDMDELHSLLRANSTTLSALFTADSETHVADKSDNIRRGILDYFTDDTPRSLKTRPDVVYDRATDQSVRSNIRSFITQFKSSSPMSARAVASVFHGINCPSFPSLYWASQKKYWRCALNVDFITMMKWAAEELRFLM